MTPQRSDLLASRDAPSAVCSGGRAERVSSRERGRLTAARHTPVDARHTTTVRHTPADARHATTVRYEILPSRTTVVPGCSCATEGITSTASS